jgi:hypothetical protein
MITFSQLGKYGRFGNQLFQIASTVGIATRNECNYSFPAWEYQEHFRNRLPPGVPLGAKKYEEQEPYYVELTVDKTKHWDLFGYFQSWKYFEHCKSQVLDYFFFEKEQRDGVAIHVRRGDYLTSQHVHPILPMQYYEEALTHFPNENITIFSDDIDWCKKNFKYKDANFFISNSDIQDFKEMASYKKFIIANSTFSYWAAYLSGSTEVIAPSNFVIGETKDDRLLPEWTKI